MSPFVKSGWFGVADGSSGKEEDTMDLDEDKSEPGSNPPVNFIIGGENEPEIRIDCAPDFILGGESAGVLS